MLAYSLNLSGGTIAIPKITFTGDFSITLISTQVAGGRFFLGGDTTAGSLELYKNNSSQIALYFATVGQFSGTATLSADVNSPDTIIVARSGSSVTVHVNGALQGTASFSGNLHVSWFGLRTGWANLPNPMRFYSCVMQDIATPSNSRTYDANLSRGSGVVLPALQGGNYGTQQNSWPSDDSEWIPYQPATTPTVQPKNIWRRFPTGRIAATNFIPWNNAEQIVDDFFEALPSDGAVISVTMPQMTVAVAASKTVPIVSASIAFSMPQMSVAVSATNAAAGVSASIAFTMPQMSVSVAASKAAPTFSSAISFTMPQMQVAASASKTVPTFTATIAATMPQMSVAASAGVTAPVFESTVSVTMPQMTVSASGSVIAAGVAASVSVAMPQMQVAISASRSVPIFGASIAFAMPQMSVATSASAAVPNYSAAISVSMPQMVVAATAENYVEGISAAITFTMPQMRVTAYSDGVIFYAAETAHIEQRIRSRSITQLARSAALYAVSRSSHINQIAKSRHIAYNYQSTHIEQRSAQNAIT